MLKKMTGGLEQRVLSVLRERQLFDIAARTHAKWKADLEAKYPKGPRGGLNPIVRSARKMQDKIASFPLATPLVETKKDDGSGRREIETVGLYGRVARLGFAHPLIGARDEASRAPVAALIRYLTSRCK